MKQKVKKKRNKIKIKMKYPLGNPFALCSVYVSVFFFFILFIFCVYFLTCWTVPFKTAVVSYSPDLSKLDFIKLATNFRHCQHSHPIYGTFFVIWFIVNRHIVFGSFIESGSQTTSLPWNISSFFSSDSHSCFVCVFMFTFSLYKVVKIYIVCLYVCRVLTMCIHVIDIVCLFILLDGKKYTHNAIKFIYTMSLSSYWSQSHWYWTIHQKSEEQGKRGRSRRKRKRTKIV